MDNLVQRNKERCNEMKRIFLTMVLLAFVIPMTATLAGDGGEKAFTVEMVQDGQSVHIVTPWVTWADGQKLKLETQFQVVDYFANMENSLLIVVSETQVRAFDLATAGVVKEVELEFPLPPDGTQSKFFMFDKNVGSIGRWSVISDSKDQSITVTLSVFLVGLNGVTQVQANLPCGILDVCASS